MRLSIFGGPFLGTLNELRKILMTKICSQGIIVNRQGSRTFFNETSQFAERYSAHMQAVRSEKNPMMLGQIYLSKIK